MKTVYKLKPEGALVFSSEAIRSFTDHRQPVGADEAGGILLGRLFRDSGVVVEVATPPGPFDKAGPRFFHRSRESAQQHVDKAWHDSGGEQVYLGEWHTHPSPVPLPSWRDRTMIRNMFKQTRMEISFLILVVVGYDENWVGIQDKMRLIYVDE